MDLSAAGAAFTRHHEGFVDHWYADAVGVGTIGIGFTWRSAAFRSWWEKNRPGKKFGSGAKMTREEADEVLQLLAAEEYGAALNKFLGSKKVAQHVWDGAFSPVFNLGPGSLNWKWAAALKRGDVTEAAKLLRTTGTTAKGKKLRGLENRRKEEAELIALGDYTVGKVYADPLADGVLPRGERGQPVIDLQAALDRDLVTLPGRRQQGDHGAIGDIGHSHALMAGEIGRRCGDPATFEIARRRHEQSLGRAQRAQLHRAVGQRPQSQRDIDAFTHQVDPLVGEAKIDGDVGILVLEGKEQP